MAGMNLDDAASSNLCKHSNYAFSGAQWDFETKVMKRMQQKLDFKRNPRFDYMLAPPKAADVGPSARGAHRGAEPGPTAHLCGPQSTTAEAKRCFVCEPAVLQFTEWQPGKAYDLHVKVGCLPHTSFIPEPENNCLQQISAN
jgi:hypothetical protein